LGLTAQDAYVKNGSKLVGLGTDADTLTASSELNYTIELVEKVYGILQLAVENETLSGSCEYTAYLQKSLNGRNWLDVDTIAYVGGSSAYAEFDLVNATHTFFRVNVNATATTQKSKIYIWGKLSDGFVITE
jgi:hypothetical protein